MPLIFSVGALAMGWFVLVPRARRSRRAEAKQGRPSLAPWSHMIEFYPQIKWLHVAAVISSGLLFALRGLVLQFGAGWPMAWPVRYLSYSIDIVLLGTAVMLATILQQYPFVHGWLTVKVALLALYVALGSFALKRGRTRAVRAWCWVSAMAVYLAIIGVARSHDPLGPFRMLEGQ